MKKIIFSLLFTFFISMVFAQDMKKLQKYVADKQLDKAKTEVDALVAKDPANNEANYFKAKVYGMIADSAQFQSLVQGDAKDIAFDAVKKALDDTANAKVALIAAQDKYQALFNLYSSYYGAGAKAFNDAAASADKAGYADAMNKFIKANEVGRYIVKKNYAKVGDIDTTLVLNI